MRQLFFDRSLADRDVWLREFGSLPGDANLDGVADARDLSALGENWLSEDASWSTGDFTGDGLANVQDLGQLGIYWTQTGQDFAAQGAPLPEPNCLLMAAMGMFVLICRRGCTVKSKQRNTSQPQHDRKR